jgi:hypothetical protein
MVSAALPDNKTLIHAYAFSFSKACDRRQTISAWDQRVDPAEAS